MQRLTFRCLASLPGRAIVALTWRTAAHPPVTMTEVLLPPARRLELAAARARGRERKDLDARRDAGRCRLVAAEGVHRLQLLEQLGEPAHRIEPRPDERQLALCFRTGGIVQGVGRGRLVEQRMREVESLVLMVAVSVLLLRKEDGGAAD